MLLPLHFLALTDVYVTSYDGLDVGGRSDAMNIFDLLCPLVCVCVCRLVLLSYAVMSVRDSTRPKSGM